MLIKRGIYFGVLFLAGLLVVSSFVFGQEDPDLAPFDATVTVGNTPPTIVNFEAVVEAPDDVGTPLGEIQGEAGGAEGDGLVDVSFKFTVEDPNGPSDLPGCVSGGAEGSCADTDPDDGPELIVGTNINVVFVEPVNDPTPGTNSVLAFIGSCYAEKCSDGANPDCSGDDGGTDIALQKQFICNVTMNYYLPPSPNGGLTADDRWTISATIFDSTGVNTDTKSSGDTGFSDIACLDAPAQGNDCDYIIYRSITGVSTEDSLAWTDLDINNPDQPADPPGGISLDNVGNGAVTDELVTGQDLVESSNGGPCNIATDNCLAVAAFSAGPLAGGSPNVGACDATGGGGAETGGVNLVDESAQTVPVPIAYSADGSDSATMYFCVWDTVNPTHVIGGPIASYVANAANSNRWVVTFNT